jgi:uncharacterized Rmd1/YagE family protein
MHCAAYTVGQNFHIKDLFSYLKSKYTVNRMREVLHVSYQKGEDVFFFPYGPVVLWGLSEAREQEVLTEVKPFLQSIAAVPEDDEMSFSYGNKPKIQDDEIILPDHNVLSKLAYSHGLAQSGILGLFEETLQRTSHLTKSLPEELARNGNIRLSRKDMRRMMGQLYLDRSSINLQQELLDTPDFFWEHSDLEAMYMQMAHYMDIERRVNVLNQRLGIVQELFDMLGNELNHQHSSHLEWTIIWLILIEVVLSLMGIFRVF